MSNEITKYIKKKKSSTSKSKAKSKHKHEYVDCLFIKNNKPYKGTYCKICNKIKDMALFETEKIGSRYRILDDNEVFEKYKDLEKRYIGDI